MAKNSERAHNRAKHNVGTWSRPKDMSDVQDDAQTAWRRDYFRNVRPDLDPQSTASKIMEFFGADTPYAQNAQSYDYRQKAWDDSVKSGNPDMSWSLPGLTDEGAENAAIAAEKTLGTWNPALYAGATPLQSNLHPFPDSWMGKRNRSGNASAGAMAHAIQQWEWLSPYQAADLLSVIGPDNPETVQRDIDAWKGGASSVDRAIGGIVGADMGAASTNPYVDPVEIGSLAATFAVPMGAAQKAKRAEQAAQKAARRAGSSSRTELTASANRTPHDAPTPKPDQKPKPRATPQEPGDVRGDIEEAFRRRRK